MLMQKLRQRYNYQKEALADSEHETASVPPFSGKLQPSHHLHLLEALVHESELARNEPDSQAHHLPRGYDDGLPSSAIRLRM